MDWKGKIDRKIEQDKIDAEKQRQKAEEERILLAKQREQQELERRRQELADKFSCHICGKRAQFPLRVFVEAMYDADGNREDPYEYDDWSVPGDLEKCSICQQWTCTNHIYKGICQKCAEKL